MAPPPRCTKLGPQCAGLSVVLRVAALEDGVSSADPEATWLFGHTERISFGKLWRDGDHLYTRARLHVPCRYLQIEGEGARCTAHRFSGPGKSVRERRSPPAERRLGGDKFEYVSRGRLVRGTLPKAAPPRRSLPVADAPNPCATARCRTADNRIGAGCCRDLQVEVLCGPRATKLEALLKSRKSPFLCKVEREEPDSMGVEMISACAFLEDDGRLCALHGRRRPNGTEAKPGLCFDWPKDDSTYHRGCVFKPAS
ncbi:MAG: hypothetical protein AB7R55_21810 [Gemmatimonadales bacterium]